MTDADGPGFETALSELEEIVRALDRDEMQLDEALELFRQGVGHLRTANRLLDEAEGQVEELIEEASGELETVDFDVGGSEEAAEGGG
ncbi:MAG: exodeoxyribonuclease VII small subunit [Candidatus Palauibacterales bacterium]|nr:exodeoxyribonuclease VII small subunit [Candidatus Palauibacterales bacterium]